MSIRHIISAGIEEISIVREVLIALVLCVSGCNSNAHRIKSSDITILEARIEKLEEKVEKSEKSIIQLIEAAIIQNDFSGLFDERISTLETIEFKKVFPHTLKELARKALDQLNNDYND